MNRLANETSPYLLQHQHNPVDWYAWSAEALAKALAEDRPILLSVGYSACHWCHVMERESFENPQIAALMNESFVNIKVDREERPDIDAIYMAAVQTLTGQGGWPMTVFLTPDGKPFYGGTYFPPQDMHGRPGFPSILQAVAEAWQTQRAELEQQGMELLEHLNAGDALGAGGENVLLTSAILDVAYNKMAAQFDPVYGGFGSAPKFPQPANLDFLLRYAARTKRQEPLAMVERTLQKMALGGMYDQLGGGFHRYSTDREWLVPHFEKMLYDNAQLAQTYARCYQATGNAFYRGVAEETLEYILREMTGPEGQFYSAQDADSEGVEGKFFVWTPAQIVETLGERDGVIFCAFYDVTPGGNWEEANILRVVRDARDVAQSFDLTVGETAQILDEGKIKLREARESRVKPLLDDKALTAWNGLMLAAFAECGAIFERKDFIEAAVRNADFVLNKLSNRHEEKPGGLLRLRRTYRNGESKLNGYLEDYAFYACGLIALYEATGDTRRLTDAQCLASAMKELFFDETDGGFFATSSDHEALIQRPKDWDDNATPSGNSVAIEVLLKLGLLTGAVGWPESAVPILRKLAPVMEKHPYGFARILGCLDFHLSAPKEIAIVGDLENEATKELLRAVYAQYIPNKIVALGGHVSADAEDTPLLEGKTLLEGKPTAYVCENYACQQPVTTSEELKKILLGADARPSDAPPDPKNLWQRGAKSPPDIRGLGAPGDFTGN